MRKRLRGEVISDKRNKTVTVRIEYTKLHPLYKKYIKKITKLHCHDEKNNVKIGDKVIIEETRPLSKTKHHRVVEIIKTPKHLNT